MAEFLLLMHGDSARPDVREDWEAYLNGLAARQALRGGSAIGRGLCVRRDAPLPSTTDHLVGYMKIEARDLDHARELIAGNPVYEAGGTVEIRELPQTG